MRVDLVHFSPKWTINKLWLFQLRRWTAQSCDILKLQLSLSYTFVYTALAVCLVSYVTSVQSSLRYIQHMPNTIWRTFIYYNKDGELTKGIVSWQADILWTSLIWRTHLCFNSSVSCTVSRLHIIKTLKLDLHENWKDWYVMQTYIWERRICLRQFIQHLIQKMFFLMYMLPFFSIKRFSFRQQCQSLYPRDNLQHVTNIGTLPIM